MLTIILSGVGGSANWIAFLLPFLLLLIIVKTGEWLNKWIRSYLIPKFSKKKRQQHEDLSEAEFRFT